MTLRPLAFGPDALDWVRAMLDRWESLPGAAALEVMPEALSRLRPALEGQTVERAAGFSGWQGDRWIYRVVW